MAEPVSSRFAEIRKILFLMLAVFLLGACRQIGHTTSRHKEENKLKGLQTSRPYARYWWFASEIQKEDVKYNLDWLKANGFGGVELAWVYPLNAMDQSLDTAYMQRYAWLGPEWQELVEYSILYADTIGLACDITLGTLWPFGDSHVPVEQSSRRYGKRESQMISKSWEYPKKGYVVDHLNKENYLPYFERMLDSFPNPETNNVRSAFIDSWEVDCKELWAEGFGDLFYNRYAYRIEPLMDSIYHKKYIHQLYDYRNLISEKVIRFYRNFDSAMNNRGLLSRGQCSGAPCDLISAYAQLDIPEGESMLYEPEFNAIPSSAALLSGKQTVSAESFTCLYGWPRNHIREEQSADLKLVADALFANGVNHIIWHGKAHNSQYVDTTSFYATVHLGNDGTLAEDLPEFNRYLENVSETMKSGRSYSNVAVYLPTEDAWMKGEMPKQKQFIWAWAYYEMRYVYFPDELAAYHPVWLNRDFLCKGKMVNGKLQIGEAEFNALYVDAEYLPLEVLLTLKEFAEDGLQITLKQTPREPGTIKHSNWEEVLSELYKLESVSDVFRTEGPALIGEDLPPYWARVNGDTLSVFFANPMSKSLKFPIKYGQSYSDTSFSRSIDLQFKNELYSLRLVFEPYQSLLYKFHNGIITQLDISFKPVEPNIIPADSSAIQRWLVH
jgi:hypothetical protein